MSLDPENLPIRHHHIRAMLKSPAHYLAVRVGQAEDDPSYAMERGSGLHEMLSGRSQVLAYPGRARIGKEYEAFVAANPGALILTASDHATASAMYDAIQADPVAGPLCRAGNAEETVQWAIPGYPGLLGRTTPDRLIIEGRTATIVEVKSARTSEPERFTWTGRRDYGYHTQAAWHATGILASNPGLTDVRVLIVVVESSRPNVVTTIEVHPSMIRSACGEISSALDRISECRASDRWPGYVEGVWSWLPDETDIVGSGGSDEPAD